jgi:hypothetical protein
MSGTAPPLFVRWRTAAAVCGAVLLVTLVSVRAGRQLGDVWNPDEWYTLGVNLAVHGTIGLGTEPTAFRPPGYPAFVALVVRGLTGVPNQVTPEFLIRSRTALYVVHALVLALAAGAMTWWWAGSLGLRLAAATALALALNPHALALVGLPHYALLHTVLLLAGAWGLAAALGASRAGPALLLAGGLWGAISLVRPTTLPLPLILLVLLLLRGWSRGRAFRAALWLGLGMVVVISPWTIRNARLRGRLIPVNAQAWTILCTASSAPVPVRPDHSNWMHAQSANLPIYERVTGEDVFRMGTLYRRDVDLEDAYREVTLANLRQQPHVYAANVGRFLSAVLFRTSGFLVKLHEYIQRPGAHPTIEMFEPGHPQTFERSRIAVAFKVIAALLLLPAAWGIVVAWRRGDPTSLALLSVFACVVLAQAITWMDLLYYYVRVPFLLVFAAYGLAALDGTRRPAWLPAWSGTPLALTLLGSLVILGLCAVANSVYPPLADWL